MPDYNTLRELLLALFTDNGSLQVFIEDFDPAAAGFINFNGGASIVAMAVSKQLYAHGQVRKELFEELIDLFPSQHAFIRGAQFDLGVDGGIELLSITEPWWMTPPIKWNEPEPQAVLTILVNAYLQTDLLIALAEDAGLHSGNINAGGAPKLVARRIIVQSATAGLLGNLFQVVLSDQSKAAYHDSIRQIAKGELGTEISVAQLSRRGIEKIEDAKLLENLGASIDAGAEIKPSEGLQAIVDVRQGLGDPLAFIAGISNAMRRTAMIEIGGQPAGTGFLVGNKYLLTNAHVVQALDQPPPVNLQLTMVFDFYAGSFESHHQRGRRVRGKVLKWSFPTNAEITGSSSDWNASAQNLDYALIELAEPVGDQPGGAKDLISLQGGTDRGFFHLSTLIYDFGQASLLIVTQHPLGERMALSRANPHIEQHGIRTFEVNANQTRVRYMTNTLAGSSGSSVIDDRGRLVALHHFGTSGANQGIPIHQIAAELKGEFPALVEDT